MGSNPPSVSMDALIKALEGAIKAATTNSQQASIGSYLPYPESKGAPHFSGDAFYVKGFFSDFEERATRSKLPETEWKQKIVTYVDASARHIWTSLKEYIDDQKTYKDYKEAVLKRYPDSSQIKEFTVASMSSLVEKYQVEGIKTEEDVAKYQREFEAQHTSLAKQGVPHSAPSLFLRAFDESTRNKIITRLDHKHPDVPFFKLSLANIAEAAIYLLKNFGTHGAGSALEQIDGYNQYAPAVNAHIPVASNTTRGFSVEVKTENQDDRITALVNQLVEQRLQAQQQSQQQSQSQPQQSQQRFRAGESAQQPRQTQGPGAYRGGERSSFQANKSSFPFDKCIFCGLPGHMMRECLTQEDYFKTGRVGRDSRGYLTYPGTTTRVFHDDRSIKAVLDEHNPNQAVQYYEDVMLYNSVGVESDVVAAAVGADYDDEGLSPEEVEYKLFLAMRDHVNNYESTGRLGARRMEAVEMPSRNTGPNRIAQRPKPPGAAPATGFTPNKPNGQASATVPLNSAPRFVPRDEIAKKHHELVQKGLPQEDLSATRTRAPASDDAAPDRVFQRILDLSVTMPVREVLATAPDVRKLYQKFTANKRVTIENVTVADTAIDEAKEVFNLSSYEHTLPRTNSGEFAAHDSVALHTIPISIDGHQIDAIVDSGATICCISEDLWLSLGAPIYTERATKMRDANGGSAGTLGAMTQVPVMVGGIIFYLNFHVVANAPFDCILGTPFCCVASLKSIWQPNSKLLFELTDLNGERQTILIPATPSKHRKRAIPNAGPGF